MPAQLLIINVEENTKLHSGGALVFGIPKVATDATFSRLNGEIVFPLFLALSSGMVLHPCGTLVLNFPPR